MTQTTTRPGWGECAWTEAGALASHYRDVRRFTMKLCEPLAPEDCVAQSMTDASPVKWHMAHTTWFFEEFVLRRFEEGYRVFHPDYGFLFNSYYNAVGDRVARPIRGLMTRPVMSDVVRYREHVDAAVAALLERISGPEYDRIGSLVEIGLHHEQQHQELLLTDVKHLLSLNPMRPVYAPPAETPAAPDPGAMTWARFDEGIRWIGWDGDAFAYDNESPRHRVFLDAFEIADRPVTNGEYMRFMADAGYERPELWLDEGWAAVQAHGWRAPLYWEPHEGGWRVFTLHGMCPVDLEEPVAHVSFHEARAFAEWAGARLPTEAEWETAAEGHAPAGNFAESGRYHPAVRDPSSSGRVHQVFGDLWEWTQSAYAPYPGYRPVPGALGEYNGKFMCSQVVLRGGSCATPASHIRPTYRNFFYPTARWQFTGIRLAR